MRPESSNKGIKAWALSLSSKFLSRSNSRGDNKQESSPFAHGDSESFLPEINYGMSVGQKDHHEVQDKIVGNLNCLYKVGDLALGTKSTSNDGESDSEISSRPDSAGLSSHSTGSSSSSSLEPDPSSPSISIEQIPHIDKSTKPPVLDGQRKPVCWDHGCGGREFPRFSDLLRHHRELSSPETVCCLSCGAHFTTASARDRHDQHLCKPRVLFEWDAASDEKLVEARKTGFNWGPIAARYFPGKTANACRKRYETLMEERLLRNTWNGAKVEAVARAYMNVREQMWKILADKVGEEWQTVEEKVCVDRLTVFCNCSS